MKYFLAGVHPQSDFFVTFCCFENGVSYGAICYIPPAPPLKIPF